MIGFANGRAPLRHFTNELLNLPVRWDAGWYLQIVTDGYRYVPGDPVGPAEHRVFSGVPDADARRPAACSAAT